MGPVLGSIPLLSFVLLLNEEAPSWKMDHGRLGLLGEE
jgi:hypothetical protein